MKGTKSYFICFIGIDGSGKTTQSKHLYFLLKKKYNNVSYVWCRWDPFIFKPIIKIWKRYTKKKIKENYSEFKNNKIRVLKNPLFRKIWMWGWIIEYGLQVFFKIRLKHFLKKRIIISDRYSYDSFIDQAQNLNFSENQTIKFMDSFWIKKVFPEPELVIYIDCPEQIAFARKKDIPSLNYLRDRRRFFLKMAEKKNWIKIDGGCSVEYVKECIKKIIERESFV